MKKIVFGILVFIIAGIAVIGVKRLIKTDRDKRLTIYCSPGYKEICEELYEKFIEESGYLKEVKVIETADEKSVFDSVKGDILIYERESFTNDIQLKNTLRISELADFTGKNYFFDTESMDRLILAGEIPLIYYNKKVFDELDLYEAENINDFSRYFALFKSEDICPLAFMLDAKGKRNFKYLAASLAGKDDAVYGDKNSTFSQDIEYAGALMTNSVLPVKESSDNFYDMLAKLKNKDYALLSGSSANIRDLEDVSEEIGAFMLYGNDFNTVIPFNARLMAAFSKKSTNSEVLKDFATYLISAEAQQYIYDKCRFVPAVKGVSVFELWKEIYDSEEVADFVQLSCFDRNNNLSDLNSYIYEVLEKFDLDYGGM